MECAIQSFDDSYLPPEGVFIDPNRIVERVVDRFPNLRSYFAEAMFEMGDVTANSVVADKWLELPEDAHQEGMPGRDTHAFLGALYAMTISELVMSQVDGAESTFLRSGLYRGAEVYFQETYSDNQLDEVRILARQQGVELADRLNRTQS